MTSLKLLLLALLAQGAFLANVGAAPPGNPDPHLDIPNPDQVFVAGNTDLAPGVVNAAAPPYNAHVSAVGAPCVAGGANDARQKIQDALDDVATNGGGIVFLPTGLYCIGTHLSIGPYTTLRGVFGLPGTRSTTLNYGTVLLAVENQGMPTATPFITLVSLGSTVEALSIYYPNQTVPTISHAAYIPKPYPYTIKAAFYEAAIKNVMLLNPYQGIDLFSSPNDRHFVDGVYGQPISVGIKVDNVTDIGRISNVHFVQFWTEQADVVAWIQAHGTAFIFGRTDWQIVHDVFAYGYSVGMSFSNLGNGITNGEMSNVNFDSVGVGLDIYSTSLASVHMTNLNIAHAQSSPNMIGIWGHNVAGQPANIDVVNATIWGNTQQAVLWESSSGLLTMSNFRIQSIQPGIPAVSVTAGRALIENGAFTGATAGKVDVSVSSGANAIITGNMLYGGSVPTPVTGAVVVANNL